jgi:myosin heavy subunit
VQIGKTKVFLRAGQMAELDALRTEVLGHSTKKIQSKVRSFMAKRKYIHMQQCATQLQAVCRGTHSCSKIEMTTPNFLFFSPMKSASSRKSDFCTVVSKVQLQEGVMKTFVGRHLH